MPYPRPVTVSQTGEGSIVIPVDRFRVTTTLSVSVVGTATWDVQWTIDDPQAGSQQWSELIGASLEGAAEAIASMGYPVRALRLRVTAGGGTVTLKIAQSAAGGAGGGGSGGGGPAASGFFSKLTSTTPSSHFGIGVVADASGNIYLIGREAGSYGNILKLDADGEILWGKRFTTVNTTGECIALSPSGDLYIGGQASSGVGFCSKLNSDGDVLWTRQFTATPTNTTYVVDVKVSPLGEVVVLGYTTEGALNYTGFVSKLSPIDGSVGFQTHLRPANNSWVIPEALSIAHDGTVYIVGRGPVEGWQLILNPDNTVGPRTRFAHPTSQIENNRASCTAVQVLPDKRSVVAGFYNPLGRRVWVALLDSAGAVVKSNGFPVHAQLSPRLALDTAGHPTLTYNRNWLTGVVSQGIVKFGSVDDPGLDPVWGREFGTLAEAYNARTVAHGPNDEVLVGGHITTWPPISTLLKVPNDGALVGYHGDNYYKPSSVTGLPGSGNLSFFTPLTWSLGDQNLPSNNNTALPLQASDVTAETMPITAQPDDPSWTPLELFSAGVLGAWYDPSDLSTVRANTDGTGDVAVGDFVRYLGDKSGNGNHLTQTLGSTVFAPILRQDGNGKYYLEFDGVNRFLERTSVSLAGKNRMNAVCAIQKEAVNVNTGEVFAYNGNSNPSFRIHATASLLGAHHVGSTAGRSIDAPQSFPTPGGPYVVTSIHDRQAPVLIVRGNKGQNGLSDLVPGANNYTSSLLRLGNRSASTAHFHGGVYGLVLWSDNPTYIDEAERFMAEKAGVTL